MRESKISHKKNNGQKKARNTSQILKLENLENIKIEMGCKI